MSAIRTTASAALRRAAERLEQVVSQSIPSEPNNADPVGDAIATLAGIAPLELQRRGYNFQKSDYYSALNDLAFLRENLDLWHGRPLPAGVDWDLDSQLAVVQMIAPHARELADVSREAPPGPPTYSWSNDFWRGLDALVHYGLLRHLKPARVVEVGCGWSSLLLARALRVNEAEGSARTSVHQIEPYPRRELMDALPSDWTREETILQRASLQAFTELEAGDIAFYDGSHVARAGSDVNWFFFEVIPRLAPGVVVHVHDIYWPSDYPDEWIFDRGQTWNEQYVLQAFLMFNDAFEIVVANSALLAHEREAVAKLFQGAPDGIGGGGSIWLRRRPA